MASVWKRLQRVNKRAAKFQYTASYHRIDLETTSKWRPNKLCIVWTRRSRRVVTEPLDWEPSLKDPLKGSVIYPVPENHSVAITLFKDSRTNELEDKDWTFVLEDVSVSGRRRRLAQRAINVRPYASLEPSQRELSVSLHVGTKKLAAAEIHLTLHCVLLREGQATDEDMQSLASMLSFNNNSDIAVLDDLDDEDYTISDNSTRQMLDLSRQIEEMTQSLTSSDIAATPCSVQSLNFDKTPTIQTPITPTTPVVDKWTPTIEDVVEPIKKMEKIEKPPREMIASTPKSEKDVKGVVFKTKHLSKHNLKPLDLKWNLNSLNDQNDNYNGSEEDQTPVNDKHLHRNERDKTPVQDLLEWCKEVTREYPQCKVNDLSSSWRSGLAFCAIIHHFRPDLIEYSLLSEEEGEEESNLRLALEASGRLGIPAVLTAQDVHSHLGPDRLAIMTHLFQLRAHFTGSELQVEQLGNEGSESSYLVGRHDTDETADRALFSREVSMRRQRGHFSLQAQPPLPSSPEPRDTLTVADHAPINHQQPLMPIPPRPQKLMTRKELTDPFGSDDDEPQSPENGIDKEKASDEQANTSPNTPAKSPAELPKPTPQLLSRHDELKERARQLLEATKKEAREQDRRIRRNNDEVVKKSEETNGVLSTESSPKKVSEDERQSALRERAKKLIADARAGIVSPSSPRSTPGSRPGAVEIISRQSIMDEIAAAGGAGNEEAEAEEGAGYLQLEVAALEREQAAVDFRAKALEKRLRAQMEANDGAQEEDRLMSQWFHLVNKKNALLRRQMQLNILEQEEDLSRRCDLLARELRLSLAVDDWRKTSALKQRERLLLQELLAAVNERDRLVQEMDEQEKAIADDDEIERNLSNVEIQRKNNCILQ